VPVPYSKSNLVSMLALLKGSPPAVVEALVPEPAVEQKKRGRPPIGERPLTEAEKKRRWREKKALNKS
jgi:hypothetical protein